MSDWTDDGNGSTHSRHCTAENCEFQEIGEHQWDSGTVTQEATTQEAGVKTYRCTLCGATRTESIPKLHEHSWSESWGGSGEYHWHECEAEGCGISDNNLKQGYGPHSWDGGVVTKEATTQEAGIKTYTCTVCKATKTEQIPVLPTPAHSHVWSSKWQYDSTHHWNNCTAKDCPLTSNADKYGYAAHNFGAWRIVTQATAEKDGSMERKCVDCGYVDSKVIPANKDQAQHVHSWSSWQFTAPNYWERTCSSCGTRDIKISAVTKPQITAGAKATWRQGSSGGLSFTSSAPLSEFVSVTLNGFTLAESYYSKAEGSTIITLNKSCMDQLKAGTHKIAINSLGGSAETTFTVKASSQQNTLPNQSVNPWAAPKTGDTANMGLWIGMIVVSVAGVAAVAVILVKKNKRK